MILDLNLVYMGDNVYAAKIKHEKLGLLKSIVEARSFGDAKNKINMNLKQSLWKKGVSSKDSPIHFHFNCINLDKQQISFENTPDEYKKFHPDYLKEKQDVEDPRIWSLEEVVDEAGHVSYRTVRHDTPLMNKMEVQEALMARMFK